MVFSLRGAIGTKFPTQFSIILSVLFLAACSGGGGSSSSDDTPTNDLLSTCGSGFLGTSGPNTVLMSGRITYADVPTSPSSNGLKYAQEQDLPARGVTVEACNSDGIFASTSADNNGEYSFAVPADTTMRVRVRAQLVKTGTPNWDVRVIDNTENDALYVLVGSLADSGNVATQQRDLHAPSGWTGAGYTETRSAGPFAILDTMYQTIQTVVAVNSSASFPALRVNWSVNNRPVSGNEDNGEIGTSFYRPNTTEIFVLGAANSDTDEYDDHVIAHELGHYFQDVFSRDDSIGGPHTLSNRLDMRLAFSEGWANALAGIITDEPVYRDTSGNLQLLGFGFSVETNSIISAGRGWFNEDSVQNIIYDIFDANVDGPDNISLGFGPLFDALSSSSFINFDSPLSIYLLAEIIEDQNPGVNLAPLLANQQIFGTDAFGTGETTQASDLPVINAINLGQTINVCSTDDNGVFNKLGNRRFFRVSLPAQNSYRFQVVRASGMNSSDPDMVLYRQGSAIRIADSLAVDSETLDITLAAGNYWFEVYEFNNRSGNNSGDVCFNVTVSSN